MCCIDEFDKMFCVVGGVCIDGVDKMFCVVGGVLY